jgi:aspartate racemase
MTQHIGIVACSAEGAALCYRTICLEGAALMGAHAHPGGVDAHVAAGRLHGADLPRRLGRGGRADAVVGQKLDSIGANFVICPDNTIHQALPFVIERSPVPWLHIAEVVATEAQARGFRKLGLTGTRWLVESEVYPQKLAARGIGYVRPDAGQRSEINRIIMDELVNGSFKPEAVAYFQQTIGGLARQGCDAVVLGCTEIPLIMSDANSPLPTLDSTRLLARAALRRAIDGV